MSEPTLAEPPLEELIEWIGTRLLMPIEQRDWRILGAILATLKAEQQRREAQSKHEYFPIRKDVVDFLSGWGTLEGVSFGEKKPNAPAFWWRKYLPRTEPAQQPTQRREAQKDVSSSMTNVAKRLISESKSLDRDFSKVVDKEFGDLQVTKPPLAEQQQCNAQSAQVWVVAGPDGEFQGAGINKHHAWFSSRFMREDPNVMKLLGYYAAPATLTWNKPEKE